MYPYMKKTEERILAWRELRSLIQDDGKETLEKVAKWWLAAPLGTVVIEWDKPEFWITPWEIIGDNVFCENTIAYMIFKTLSLSNLKPKLFHIVGDCDEMLVVSINGYVLNFSAGEVVTTSEMLGDYEIKHEYDELEDSMSIRNVI